MRRIGWIFAVVGLALGVGFGVGMSAAAKSYQFTGAVTSVDAGTLTVEKSPKEVWTFSTDKDTKGAAKVGDRVTVYYNMVATQIEVKAATPAAAKAPAKTPAAKTPPK